MALLASNPAIVASAIATLLLLAYQFVPGKSRNDSSRLILYGFGAFWLLVLFLATTGGRTRQMLLPFALAAFAFVGSRLRWKMWDDWGRRKYGGTKIVFDDPDGGTDSGVAPPPPPPAGWFADTTSRHQFRYWDGSRWTEHVADNGKSNVDPVA